MTEENETGGDSEASYRERRKREIAAQLDRFVAAVRFRTGERVEIKPVKIGGNFLSLLLVPRDGPPRNGPLTGLYCYVDIATGAVYRDKDGDADRSVRLKHRRGPSARVIRNLCNSDELHPCFGRYGIAKPTKRNFRKLTLRESKAIASRIAREAWITEN